MTDEIDLGIEGIGQVRALDSGGFADVYEARDEFGRRVAVKVFRALDEAAQRRFDRERSVMGMVSGHPHIVNPFTSGYRADGRPYVVMEFLAGGSLQQRLDRLGPIPLVEAISMVVAVATALEASHRVGIIHKDVKPANILVADDGTPKLADFGIASIRDVTTTTALAYSPAYSPPETFHADAGTDPRDERSDLYSLAATLFSLVVGQTPFLTGNESAVGAMMRVLNEPPPQTGHHDLDRFLAVALAKDPNHRYQDATSFSAALRAVGDGSSQPVAPAAANWAPPQYSGSDTSPEEVTVASTPGDDQSGNIGRRAPLLIAGAVIAALLVTAGIVIAITQTGSDGDGSNVAGGTTVISDGDNETSVPDEPTSTLGDTDDLAGTSVVVMGLESGAANITAIESAFQALSAETGIDISYSPISLNSDLDDLVTSGNAPDISMFAQPILLADYAERGELVPVPSDVASDVSQVWNGEWTDFGEVDGVQYGVPNKSDPKSLVWFKPARFEQLGYEVPQSWNELIALTEQAITDGNTPWCVGIESGAATGWVFTDWVEDVLLRRHGAAAYDQWVSGELRFSDPEVIEAFEEVRDIWTLPGAVHAANGSIFNTGFLDNGAPLAADDCLMHRQAPFFGSQLPAGTRLADGSPEAVDVFYLPSQDENRPLVSAGVWAAAFADRPEVWVVMRYLGSAEYANNRQAAQVEAVGSGGLSGFLTAVNGVDRNLFSPIENSILDILAVAGPVRFDASDSMPPSVGAGTFWSEGTDFLAGNASIDEAVAAIDTSWTG